MGKLKLFETGITEEEVETELLKRSLKRFAEYFWDELEPNRRFVPGWHIDAICEHLQAITRGELRNLVINIPPRHGKSLLVSVLWPAWSWATRPETRWIFSSYSDTLSKRDSIKCRRVIESARYQKLFPLQIQDDQNEKKKFENIKTGVRMATSVGGAGVGEGADFIVADDPHKTQDIHHEKLRTDVLEWWDEVMSTRGNDPKTVAKVIVMQRLHEKDLSGHVIEKGGYDHLCLPAEYTGKKYHTSIGWEDPRINEGDLLWPERFSKSTLDQLRIDLGPDAAEGQLQQDPKPAKGGTFKRAWWKRYIELPNLLYIKQYWDCAEKPGISNDFSVCATWGFTATDRYLIDIWREKVEAPQLNDAIISNYFKYKPIAVIIEDKSAGTQAIQHLKQNSPLPVIAYHPGKVDKVSRAIGAVPMVAAGKCHLPINAPWVEDFIKELEKFPLVDHDDQTDSLSMMVAEHSIQRPKPRARGL